MSLNRGTVNALNVLGFRKLSFIPEHFTKISVDTFVNVKLLDHWIGYNLNSRYAIKKQYTVDHNNKMVEVLEVGMEDPREITMLTLGCPYIHNDKKELF